MHAFQFRRRCSLSSPKDCNFFALDDFKETYHGKASSLARQLRLSKTRVNEGLRELEAAGKVRLHTSRAGTTVALAA